MKKLQNSSTIIYHPSSINPSTSFGQTLIEAIVAIGIIIMVLTTAFVLAGRTIRMGTVSRQKLQAINLAQQGIEAVRNIRDTNWIQIKKGVSGATWDNGDGDINTFTIEDNLDDTVQQRGVQMTFYGWGITENPNYFDSNLNTVLYSDDTFFTRTIDIEDDPKGTGEEKKRITVTVSWPNGQVELEKDITNWIIQ